MIKLLHTADWHIGQSFFGFDRTKEHEHFLAWLAGQIKKLEIDVLLIAGDVFDTANPSAAAQRMLYRFIRKVITENSNLQIIIIAGNHDSAARLEAPSPLLEEMNTMVKGVVTKVSGKVDLENLIIPLRNKEGEEEGLCLAVPFLRQGNYPAVDTSGNPYAEGVKKFYEEITTLALTKKKSNQCLVAMGHLQSIGAEIAEKDASEKMIIGGLEAVSPAAFANEIQYTALGHIHKAQRVGGKENIRYAGSPLPMSFAEKNYKHGVEYIVIDKGELLSVEKLRYEPSIKLLSLPPSEPVSAQEVLSMLRALPEDGDPELTPYLQILVMLEEPEPMLRMEIEEALSGKHARLTRIVSSYRKSTGIMITEEIPALGLSEMNPREIVKSTFAKTYGAEIPDELLQLFDEAHQAVFIDSDINQ